MQTRSVLDQTVVPKLREAQLTFDDSKRSFDHCPNASGCFLGWVAQLHSGQFEVESSALFRHHRNMRVDLKILCFFGCFLITISQPLLAKVDFVMTQFYHLSALSDRALQTSLVFTTKLLSISDATICQIKTEWVSKPGND